VRNSHILIAVAYIFSVSTSLSEDAGELYPKWSASFSGSDYIDPCVVRAGVKVCPTLDMNFDQAVAAQVTPDVGPAGFVLDVGGTPVRVPDGTYPDGFDGSSGNAWDMQGGYLYRAHASGGSAFNPNTAFSACVVVTPNTAITTNSSLLGKYDSTFANRSWMLYATAADGGSAAALFSDNGTTDAGHVTVLTRTLGFRPHMTSVVCITWRNAGDGTSPAALYVNRLAVAGTAAAQAPIYASTAPFSIGCQNVGTYPFPGQIHRVTFWQDVELTAAEVQHYQAGYFGYLDNNGVTSPTFYTGLSTDIPPSIPFAKADTVIEPFIGMAGQGFSRVGELVEGVGGIAWNEPTINLLPNPSAEYVDEDPEGPGGTYRPLGWEFLCSDCDPWLQVSDDHSAHGSNAMVIGRADEFTTGEAYSTCVVGSGPKNYYLDFRSMTSAHTTPGGTGFFSVYAVSWSGAACDGSRLSEPLLLTVEDVEGAGWVWHQDAFTSHADAESINLWFVWTDGEPASTMWIDAVQVRESTYPVYGFCGHSATAIATSVCAQIAPSIEPNPLNISNTGISLKVIQPYSISEITGVGWYVIYSRATSGANNLPNIQLDTGGGYIRSTVHSGTAGATDSCRNFGDPWAKDVQHEIHFSYTNNVGGDGYIWHEVDGTDYNNFICFGVGPGRGLVNGIGTSLCIGHPYSYAKGSGYVQDFYVYLRSLP